MDRAQERAEEDSARKQDARTETMIDDQDDKGEPTWGPDDPPSKSQVKRDMLALQGLGEALVALNDKQLAKIPIDSEVLLSAIMEARRITSHGARKRQLHFIAKLIRGMEAAPIQRALKLLQIHQHHDVAAFHELEQLRNDILTAGASGVELAMTRFPHGDRRQLRQMILQAQKELQQQKPPAASRKLFRYLKDLQKAPAATG